MNPAVNISRYLNHVYIKVYFQFSTYLPITLYLITIIISSLASLNFNEKDLLSTSFFLFLYLHYFNLSTFSFDTNCEGHMKYLFALILT